MMGNCGSYGSLGIWVVVFVTESPVVYNREIDVS